MGIIMILRMELGEQSYDIAVGRGLLGEAGKLLNLKRKVLIVTDTGVPDEYAKKVAEACLHPVIYTFPQGEDSKCFDTYKALLTELVRHGFTRTDFVAAVGGGVVGDLAGFAAATYMRGIDFYNLPTTLLSQIDSSIGGKTAIDFGGYKNIVGAFYQPKKVIIDPDVLDTLPARQISNGFAEAIKMSLTSDAQLFSLFESGEYQSKIEEVIIRSLRIKKEVVEKDEKENGLRRVLNFGHTVGHAIESTVAGLYHGECVALGMLVMCSEKVKPRLAAVLKKVGLPTMYDYDYNKIADAIAHDKKMSGDFITVIYVDEAGSCEMRTMPFEELK
ncbi:MAG: 3-dehydroquinate synthase, partial [Eubacteriales bacterium]|nr:3-dehydroquinate synthase [Eubacteriales bacterium]